MATNFQTNLSLFLRADDATSPLVDLSPNGNDFTVDGGTLQDPGIDGSCVAYDGVNDRDTRSHAAQVGLDPSTGSFTIAAKVINNAGGGTHTIMAKREAILGTQFYRLIRPASGFPAFAITSATGAAQKIITGGTLIDTGAIFRIHAVCDRVAQLLHIYVNGVSDAAPVDCSAVGSIANTDLVEFGAASGAAFWDGKLGKRLFWKDRALTAAEVLEHDNGGAWPETYAALNPPAPGGSGAGLVIARRRR